MNPTDHADRSQTFDAAAAYAEALKVSGLSDEAVCRRFADDIAIDLAPAGIDVTSWAFVPENARGEAVMRLRQPGILCGGAFLIAGTRSGDFRDLRVELLAEDGESLRQGEPIVRLSGSLREILTFERTALNLVSHLSGIATLTSLYVELAGRTQAKVCDTRKTLPGLRRWQKYAVRCGGGTPHREGLGDAMLVKDNHLDGVSLDRLAATLDAAANRARERVPELTFVEVEVDTLEQLRVVLTSTVDLVLLDNMSLAKLREAVKIRDATNPEIGLEASGGVNLDTVADIAKTGVDRISVGALTHSAPSLDVGLDRR